MEHYLQIHNLLIYCHLIQEQIVILEHIHQHLDFLMDLLMNLEFL